MSGYYKTPQYTKDLSYYLTKEGLLSIVLLNRTKVV